MSQESLRVAETKEKIKEAFFDIYKEKKIERISIKEIAEKAKINRGTFYVYYKDIYDLLEQTENDIIEEVTDKIKIAMGMIIKDENPFQVLPPLEFFKKHSKYLKILLGSTGDPKFIHKVKALAKKNIRELIQEAHLPVNPNIEYVMEYVASAQIGLMTFWMERDMDLPMEDIGDMIRKITMHGPIGYLMRSEHAE